MLAMKEDAGRTAWKPWLLEEESAAIPYLLTPLECAKLSHLSGIKVKGILGAIYMHSY